MHLAWNSQVHLFSNLRCLDSLLGGSIRQSTNGVDKTAMVTCKLQLYLMSNG